MKTLFGVKTRALFDAKYASLGTGRGSPACLPHAGLRRMALKFLQFPEQYAVNMAALKKFGDEFLTGAAQLEKMYEELRKKFSGRQLDSEQILKLVVGEE